ncbi:MAG: hypothetical protein D6679_09370 [Candidatus Hydrogenedentota bacterium]|nr:MAG: hypothetical protein D6679_09370 [Candidatus Hydrogenedentota bacterium]
MCLFLFRVLGVFRGFSVPSASFAVSFLPCLSAFSVVAFLPCHSVSSGVSLFSACSVVSVSRETPTASLSRHRVIINTTLERRDRARRSKFRPLKPSNSGAEKPNREFANY